MSTSRNKRLIAEQLRLRIVGTAKVVYGRTWTQDVGEYQHPQTAMDRAALCLAHDAAVTEAMQAAGLLVQGQLQAEALAAAIHAASPLHVLDTFQAQNNLAFQVTDHLVATSIGRCPGCGTHTSSSADDREVHQHTALAVVANADLAAAQQADQALDAVAPEPAMDLNVEGFAEEAPENQGASPDDELDIGEDD